MAQFIVAIGLVLVIEGLLFAAFPRAAKRLAASALESPETSLRVAGIASAVLGIVLIWLVRGGVGPRPFRRGAAPAASRFRPIPKCNSPPRDRPCVHVRT